MRYELGLRKTRIGDALRVGGAFGKGLEALGLGKTLDEAAATATTGYDDIPPWADPHAWEVERITIETLLAGWAWRWQAENAKLNFKPEMVFRMTVRRPNTSRSVEMAGKLDALIFATKLDAAPFDMMEFKTTSEDIEDGQYWDRLRLDPQITIYRKLMENNGYSDGRIFYDVTRKPNIEPLSIPLRDGDGIKIVHDRNGQRVVNKDGKSWRQAGDAEAGYFLQSRQQTPQEFGARLLADIQARPSWYYQRREIPRVDAQVEQIMQDSYSDINDILRARKNGKWSKNPGRMTCDYCEYKSHCQQGSLERFGRGRQQPDLQDQVEMMTDGQDFYRAPEGFEFVANKHPELENGNDHS